MVASPKTVHLLRAVLVPPPHSGPQRCSCLSINPTHPILRPGGRARSETRHDERCVVRGHLAATQPK